MALTDKPDCAVANAADAPECSPVASMSASKSSVKLDHEKLTIPGPSPPLAINVYPTATPPAVMSSDVDIAEELEEMLALPLSSIVPMP